jgi:uncharacterized protein (DUF1499 family)
MTALLVIVGLVLVAAAIACALLEKRPGYGVYYGIGKLTGSRLDIGPVDWASLRRHATDNDALVCPTVRCPSAKPDQEAKIYPVAPADLLARFKAIALAQPDTSELPCDPNCERAARFVQYTRLMRYPDTIDVEVFPEGENRSTLAIYSRSLVGRRDFGVNRARIAHLLAKLDKAV